MNQNILFILLVSLLFINVNSAPQKKDNYLNRHVRPLNVRRMPGRWWPGIWNVKKPDVHKPEEKKEEPETKVEGGEKAGKVLVCYLGSWANYRLGDGKFVMEDINPNLCTHIVYGFAKLENNKITPFDPWLDLEDEWGLAGYRRFNELRKQNPSLKTLIAIGGWNEGSEKYSAMARSASTRAVFVQSVVDFLTKYGFDGLDFDWEYPANRGGIPEDKQNFVECLKELRAAFGSKWLLTSAVSAGRGTIDSAYNIPEMNRLCDFINLMGYDMHGAWHDYTGHNAPLFERPGEPDDERMLNIDYAVRYWINEGASPSKITLGMPVYGRTFTLVDPNKHDLYDKTSGPGQPGEYTNEAGMIGYHELCRLQQTEGSFWTRYWDEHYMAPYMVKGNQWIGFDDQESITIKARYVLAKGLAGGMIWSLDTDDFKNRCGKGAYPILTTIKNTLASGSPLPLPPDPENPPTLPPSTAAPPTVPPTTSQPGSEFKCSAVGSFRHPQTCQKYYQCTQNGASFDKHEMSCAPGTFFSQSLKHCDWASNVADCKSDGTPLDANHPEKKIEDNTGDNRCKEEGIFPNENECRSYIICTENPYVGGHKFIAEEQFCPDGLVFDDKLKTCNNRQFVERCN